MKVVDFKDFPTARNSESEKGMAPEVVTQWR